MLAERCGGRLAGGRCARRPKQHRPAQHGDCDPRLWPGAGDAVRSRPPCSTSSPLCPTRHPTAPPNFPPRLRPTHRPAHRHPRQNAAPGVMEPRGAPRQAGRRGGDRPDRPGARARRDRLDGCARQPRRRRGAPRGRQGPRDQWRALRRRPPAGDGFGAQGAAGGVPRLRTSRLGGSDGARPGSGYMRAYPYPHPTRRSARARR